MIQVKEWDEHISMNRSMQYDSINIFFGNDCVAETKEEAVGIANMIKTYAESKEDPISEANTIHYQEPPYQPNSSLPWITLAEQKLDPPVFGKIMSYYGIMLTQPWVYGIKPCYDLSECFDFEKALGGASFWLWVQEQLYGEE